jgi:hypothetical protein
MKIRARVNRLEEHSASKDTLNIEHVVINGEKYLNLNGAVLLPEQREDPANEYRKDQA